MPMDYFVWVAVSSDRTVVVDAGFTPEVAARRGTRHLLRPAKGLEVLGIDCARVPCVVLTHLHYDHVGNLEDFPAATFVVQEEEMAFWTGRYAGKEQFSTLIETDDVLYVVQENFRGRLRLVTGSREIVPGKGHRPGGHLAGLQVVRVKTVRGNVVLASDATHFYADIEEDRPYSIASDLALIYGAFDLVRALADSPHHVVPGHDPLVMERSPPARQGLQSVAIRVT